ncbi:hypothetical protein BH11CYA1_BH11CYA1_22660 [soil metagenome]
MSSDGAAKRIKLAFLPALLCGTLLSASAYGNSQEQPKKIVDLTHVLGTALPDFHAGKSAFEYKMLFTIEKDGYADGQFSTPEHYGTHLDAPSHFYKGAQSVDQISADKLILPCVSKSYGVHKKALAQGVLLIENLNNLELLPAQGATIFIGVLPIRNGTGSPARVIAQLPEQEKE